MTAPYAPTDWVDNATPVDEAHMDKMEAGIAAAVVMDSELAAAVRLVANKLLAAHANPAFRIKGDGTTEWGPGGATAPDVNLYRGGAATLKTDSWLYVVGQLLLGTADTNLYRGGANIVKSDDKLDPASLNLQTKAGAPIDADILGGAADGDLVLDTTNSRLYLRLGGVWHYCAINDGAAAGGADWEGAWNSGFAYQQGDVVTYNGVTYIAVNPSTNVVPSGGSSGVTIGTSLPGSPIDGQVFTLVDSLTAPTYAWRFQYIAAKASNKWQFVGGSPLFAAVDTAETTLSATYAALATAGPSITLPVTGDYIVAIGYLGQTATTGSMWMSYDIGGTAALDADGLIQRGPANTGSGGSRERRKAALAAGTALVAKYKSDGTNVQTWSGRWMRVHPVAVGG